MVVAGSRRSRFVPWLAAAAALLAMAALVVVGEEPPERGTARDGWRLAGLWGGAIVFSLAFAAAVGGGRRRVVGRAGAMLAPVGVTLLLLELPVLFAGHDWRRVLPPAGDDVFVRLRRAADLTRDGDPVLLHTRPPSGRVTGTTFGDCVSWLGAPPGEAYPYDVRYDTRGYRNARELAKADIVVIGDSFIEAALVATDDLLTERMGRSLGRDVANLGVGGYGPQQELEVLRRHGLPLAPRLVYWCLFEGNDLLDAARYEERRAQLAQSHAKQSGFLIRSFGANALAALRGALRPRPAGDARRALDHSGVVASGPAAGTRLYFPYPAGPLGETARAGLERIEEALAAAREQCRAAGAELVAVFIPEKFRVYRDLCRFDAGSAAASWTLSDLPERWGALLGRLGVPGIDLTEPLRRSAASGPLLHFADDGHWNAAAHAQVAARLGADAAARLR